jgi:hypothetical protein
MAKISDLKLAYQVFMKAYPYRGITSDKNLAFPLDRLRSAHHLQSSSIMYLDIV